MAFLAAENENRQREDFSQADFGGVPERFLLLVRTNSINDNFLYWKLRFLFGDCRSFYFHLLIKSTLHVSEGMLRLYDKQNSNTWLHVDMKFSSRVQLDISLVRFSYSWAIELNTRREIPYLRAPMYYYLCISSELTRFFRLVSVFRRTARFWTCNFSWSCHMISGRKLLYTKLQWIVF